MQMLPLNLLFTGNGDKFAVMAAMATKMIAVGWWMMVVVVLRRRSTYFFWFIEQNSR